MSKHKRCVVVNVGGLGTLGKVFKFFNRHDGFSGFNLKPIYSAPKYEILVAKKRVKSFKCGQSGQFKIVQVQLKRHTEHTDHHGAQAHAHAHVHTNAHASNI